MSVEKHHEIAAEIIEKPAKDWLTETYLPFALYVIQHRALVDTSGMKPVNRRILWSMYKNGITPSSKHLKAARAAADCVAYHPHGSMSIEDALAKMAQGFNLRVPLIDPQGSVGKVAGDTPAAARYWEARLTKAAMELVKEVSDGAVEMGKNFDGELDEPKVLPIRWPVEIINGSQGIAVGFSSSMFAHNPTEVIAAARKILKNPELTVKQLLKIMPGPDLPSGGELFEIDGVEDYYATGSGRFTIRARYQTENLARGKMKITFYELPYQISAGEVMQKIRDLQSNGNFKEIASVKDLTDKKNGMRLVIETKAGTNHLSILQDLFKKTQLESKFSVNNTVLVEGNPVQLGMLDLFKNFIEFRKLCTINKVENRLSKIENRLHQLTGLLSVLLDIDKAIAIIRKSDTAELANEKLQKAFKIDEKQADYILAMQLRRLTKQDSVTLKNEAKDLENERNELNELLASEEKLIALIDKELVETGKIIADNRRTIISGVTSEELKESQKALAQAARDGNKNLPCYITRFADGRILKTETPFVYKQDERKFANSPIIEQIKMKTQDLIVIIGSDGIGRRIPLSYVSPGIASRPEDMGITMPRGVKLVGISKSESMKSDVGIAMATKKGEIKIAKTDFPKGEEFPVFLLQEGDRIIDSRWIGRTLASSWFTLTSKSGNILVFQASTIRVAGSKAGGVRGMKLKNASDDVIDFSWIQTVKDAVILSQAEKTIKATSIVDIPTKNKGGMGVALHGFTKDEKSLKKVFVGVNAVTALSGVNNSVANPPMSRRAGRGVDFLPEVSFGSFEVQSM